MAGQIRISPEQMRGRATEYRTEAGRVEEVISKMDNLLKDLMSEWEGEASVAYMDKFNELRPGFVKARELINDIATALDNTAKSLEETDAAIGAQFRA